MGSAAHFGRIYWCGKRPAEEAYNGPFLSWVDLPANMSPAHPQVVKPLGITSGKIPDSAINATSERGNYEAKNIRLNSVTGWCGLKQSFTYVSVELNELSMVKAILVKGVITDDVVGRPTELRYK